MSQRASLAPLEYRAFRYLLSGRFASLLGNGIAPIALAFAVLDLSGSATALGLIVACRTIPQIFLMLFGGVIADRFPRDRVIVVANSLGAGTQGLAALLLITGTAELWQLAAIEAANGAVTAFAFPATSALTPQTVPNKVLQQANALLRLAINAAMISGAVLGGILVASIGSGWAMGVDAVTFGVGAVLFARIRLKPTPQSAEGESQPKSSVLSDLRNGWQEFLGRTWIWTIVLAASFMNAAWTGSVGVLGPLLADESFGRTGWGLVLASSAAGMATGALVALRVRPVRTLRVGVLAIMLMVPLLVAMGLSPVLGLLLPTAFIAGVGLETFGIYWDLSLQQHVSEDVLSRVYSYDALGSFVFVPLGQIAAGPLAIAAGTQDALLLAAGIVVIATLAMLAVPTVRNLERTDLSIEG